jgi:hypothetical protein
MLHACFTPFASCFVYTLWHFYTISGTNLLMRCHSASSLFSTVFVFQKSYIGNILGIGRNEDRNSYFSRTKDEDRKRAGEGPEGHLTRGWCTPPPGRAKGWWGLLVALWRRLSAYLKPPKVQTLNQSCFLRRSHAASPPPPMNFGGQKSLFRNPVRTRKCPRSNLHRRRRLLRRLHQLHRHLHQRCCLRWWGRSSSPPGLRALPVAM